MNKMGSNFAGHLSEFEVELNFNYDFADESTTCCESEPAAISNNNEDIQQIKTEEITIVEGTIKTEPSFFHEAPTNTENVIDGSQEGTAKLSKRSKSRYSCNGSKSRSSLKCRVCEIDFNSIAQKRKHIKLHYSNQIPLCHMCGITVKTMEQLVQHYGVHKVKKIKKPVTKVQIEPVKKFIKNEENSRDNMSTKVNENHKGAVNKFNKARTSDTTSKVKSEIISGKQSKKHTNNNNLVIRPVRKKKKPQQEYEETNAMRQAEVERIYKTSFVPLYKPWSTQRHYKCSECSKEVRVLSRLRKHLNGHLKQSRSIKEHKCGICEKIFKRPSALSRHLLVHTNQKDFKCSLCPKTFTFKYNLELHLKHHSQVKDFYCAICLRPFLLKIHLKNHLLTHRKRNEEFKCPICPKVFQLKSSMTNHAKSHPGEGGFQCRLCSKSFTSRLNLSRHLLRHTNRELKFKCFHCLKGFMEKRHLVIHMITHSNVRNYKCEQCSSAFKLRYHLTQHIKKIH